MKNLYVLVLKTNEEKPYNKFCHLVTKHIEDKLEWLDIVSEDFPKVTIKGTEEEINGLVDYLTENGFEIQVEKMKIISALNMNWEEYKDVVEKATDGKSTLMSEVGGWDYVCENGYEYSVEEIHELVGKYLGVKILSVVIDITNEDDCVVIVIE